MHFSDIPSDRMCTGLFVMTKGAAYLLGPPLLIFTGLAIFRATKRSAWRPFAAIAVIALTLNVGHHARNYELFGSPFGPKHTYKRFLNEHWSPAHLLSRLVRDLSLQMGGRRRSKSSIRPWKDQ